MGGSTTSHTTSAAAYAASDTVNVMLPAVAVSRKPMSTNAVAMQHAAVNVSQMASLMRQTFFTRGSSLFSGNSSSHPLMQA